MRSWIKDDLAHASNLQTVVGRAELACKGTEVLAFANALAWLSTLKAEIKDDLDRPPPVASAVETSAALPEPPKIVRKK